MLILELNSQQKMLLLLPWLAAAAATGAMHCGPQRSNPDPEFLQQYEIRLQVR